MATQVGATTLDSEYDYIVVGSGAGGGTVAANLARAGFSVLVLEAGGEDEPHDYQIQRSMRRPSTTIWHGNSTYSTTKTRSAGGAMSSTMSTRGQLTAPYTRASSTHAPERLAAAPRITQ